MVLRMVYYSMLEFLFSAAYQQRATAHVAIIHPQIYKSTEYFEALQEKHYLKCAHRAGALKKLWQHLYFILDHRGCCKFWGVGCWWLLHFFCFGVKKGYIRTLLRQEYVLSLDITNSKALQASHPWKSLQIPTLYQGGTRHLVYANLRAIIW